MKTKIIDREKCIGCKNCELACIAAHTPEGSAANAYATNTAERSRNKVELDSDGNRFPQLCRHCDDPACVSACMSGALTKGEDGLVTCDTDICVGCYMCVMSCPYGNARPSMGSNRVMIKCDGCHDKECMACVEACPTGCLQVADGSDAVQYVEPNQE